jgi:hypothetical protein
VKIENAVLRSGPCQSDGEAFAERNAYVVEAEVRRARAGWGRLVGDLGGGFM